MVATAGAGWNLAPSLIALVKECDQRAPDRSTLSDGSIGDLAHASRTSDHNPSDGWVCAVDITDDKTHGCDADLLARRILASRDPRVKYVIWNGTIAKSYPSNGHRAWEPQPYTGTNPHDKHTHVSIHNTATARGDTRPWWPRTQEDDMADPAVQAQLDRIEHALIGEKSGLYSILKVVRSISAEVGGDDVDEAALAAQLAPLLSASIATITDADLTRIAEAVADEQAARQQA